MSTVLTDRTEMRVAPVRRPAVAAALVLVALLLCLPFVAPGHRYPLTMFDSEWISAATLASVLIAAAVSSRARLSVSWPLPAVALILAAAGVSHYLLGMLRYTYAFSSLLIYLCAFVCSYLVGRWLVAAELRVRAQRAICVALVIGGVLSVAVQLLQVFDVRAFPTWLAFPIYDKMSNRRPFGNLAQPNQLASYLIWATVAAMHLLRAGAARSPLLVSAAVCFAGLALTGSRMGALFGLVLLGLVVTRHALSPAAPRDRARVGVALVLGYAVGLVMTRYFLVDSSGMMATAIERYAEGSFGQRLSMWADALRIALAYPWLGVGVGEYGGAQYLLAQPDPNLLATNNPHNLVLHVAAEFGLPAATAVVAIVGWWCWQRVSDRTRDSEGTTALICILFLLAHSMLEYPLWHLHFLVALALLVGIAEPPKVVPAARQIGARAVFAPIGIAMLCAAPLMKADYNAIASVWDGYLHEQFDGVPHGPETISGVLGLRDLTYFEPQIDRLYVELLPVQAQQGAANIDVSARVLTRLADVPVIMRHIQLLLQAGRLDETYPHIARLKVFAGSSYPGVRQQIEDSIAQNGPVLDPVRRALAAP